MILAVREYMKAYFLGGAGQIGSIIDIEYLMRLGLACFGSDAVDLVIRLAGSFFVRKYVFVEAVHESVLFSHMLIMHRIGVGYEHGAVLFGHGAEKPDHPGIGFEYVVPYFFKLHETHAQTQGFFDRGVKLMRGDLSAVIKHLDAGANKIIFDVLCIYAGMFCKLLKGRIKVEEEQHFSQVK